MSMKAYEDIKNQLCDELEEIARKGEMSAGDLETVHKLTDTIKNILKIEMLEIDQYSRDEGYSERRYSRDMEGDRSMNGYGGGNWNATGNYNSRMMDDRSGARRGMHYVRGHYSRDDARTKIADQIQDLMQSESLNSTEKNALKKALEVL